MSRNAPGLIQCLLSLLRFFAAESHVLWFSLEDQACCCGISPPVQLRRCSTCFWSDFVSNFLGCWVLIQRAAEWPCCLCCCGRAAEMPLLEHKEEWNPLAMSACPSRACLYKGKTWLCPCRISLGKKKIPQRLCTVSKSKVFQQPCEDTMPSLGLCWKNVSSHHYWGEASFHHTALWLFRAVIALHVRLMESWAVYQRN